MKLESANASQSDMNLPTIFCIGALSTVRLTGLQTQFYIGLALQKELNMKLTVSLPILLCRWTKLNKRFSVTSVAS